MIRVKSIYTKEKIEKITKNANFKGMFGSAILSLLMIVLGGFYVVGGIIAIKNGGNRAVLNLVLGIIMCLLSIYPIWSTLSKNKKAKIDTIDKLSLNHGDLCIEYEFREKRFDVKLTQNTDEKRDTVMIKNVSLVRNSKEGIAIYLQNGEMYYIEDKEFVEGNRDKLISLFVHNGIKIKK